MTITDTEERIPAEHRTSAEPAEEKPRDPGFYSVDPRGEIPEEHFEGDEDVVADWDGSSVDFTIGDDE